MIKILFICHGNICRSPMAEFVMKDIIQKEGKSTEYYVASAATSFEEIGNPVHSGTRNKLRQVGISTEGKYAVHLEKTDYEKYDFLIGMDSWNIKNIMKIIGKDPDRKVYKLLDFTEHPTDIDDPWYTHDFDTTYKEVLEGCQALWKHINR
mgnify:CR=1 FL=1